MKKQRLSQLLLDVAELGAERGATSQEIVTTLRQVHALGKQRKIIVRKRKAAPQVKEIKTGRGWTPNSTRTGKVPFGYKRTPGRHSKLVIDQRQLDMIPNMLKMSKHGMSPSQIHAEVTSALRLRKIKTNLSLTTVYRIVANEHQFTRDLTKES